MENEQDVVAAILKSTPPPDVPRDFLARVNARIDADERPRHDRVADERPRHDRVGSAGWLGIADFRLWTLRLAPAAAALALVAVLWAAPSSARSAAPAAPAAAAASNFSPSSSSDWQKDVSGDALLDAALTPRGGTDVR